MYDAVGAVINRIPGWDIKQHIDTGDIPILAYIQSDETLATCDIKGENIMLLPDDALIVKGGREILTKLNILKG